MEQKNKLSKRTKWSYSLGGIGRDMTYALVATFFLTYVQYAVGLTAAQFSVIGVILIIGRVWDAVNDPIMGAIIENTRTRWGKFKPWVLIGAVFTAIVIIVMFNWRPMGNAGWNYVIFFAVIYLLWEIAFTMNDISYWSMLPALTTDEKERNSITTLAVVFAGVGAFAANAGINFITVGNAIKGYSMVSIIIALFLVACQLLTVFGVKQTVQTTGEIAADGFRVESKEDKVTFKKMFNVIRNNDQLLWIILAMLLYNVGSGILHALGYNFLYMELGYDGFLAMVFVATFGVSNIGIQAFYSKLVNKFGRNKLLLYSFIAIAVGYLLLFFADLLPFLPMSIITVCFFGIFCFAGQAIFYMILTVNIANTVEYNEYRTNERNEAVIFSLRPFMAKMASALQQGIVTLVLVTSGIFALSQNVTFLENQKADYDKMDAAEQEEYKLNVEEQKVILDGEEFEDLTEQEKLDFYEMLKQVDYRRNETTGKEEMYINEAADLNFKNKATSFMRWYLRSAITLAPTLLIYLSYLVLRKKYIIDEEMYQMMVKTIAARKNAEGEDFAVT
ncbi:MAG: MFS transporter [Acholeplasmataceae bacterium]|nr:MFS transporter [Acholeplasmataceae bacterium]